MDTLHVPNKKKLFLLLLPVLVVLSARCTSVNLTSNLTGISDYATLVNKNFVVIGPVLVNKTETHYVEPFLKRVEGSKVTYTDLIIAAAELGADDIIDVRIDIRIDDNDSGKISFADWLTGSWTRTFTYTGTALAIVYIDKSSEKVLIEPLPEEKEVFEFYQR